MKQKLGAKTVRSLQKIFREANWKKVAIILAGILVFFVLLIGATYFINIVNEGFQKDAQQYESLRQYSLQLVSDCNDLGNQANALQLAYNNLQSSYGTLQQNYNSSQAYCTKMEATYKSAVEQMTSTYSGALQNIGGVLENYVGAQKVPYVVMRGREVIAVFKLTDGNIVAWTWPASTFETYFVVGNYERTYGNHYKILTGENGTKYTVKDYAYFVTPNFFDKIINPIYDKRKSNEDFVRETWHIVTQLTPYSTDLSGIPRYPAETLSEGGADCGGLSILFASMIRSANKDWKVQLVYINSNNPTQLSAPNHVAVLVDTGDWKGTIDVTQPNNMTPFENTAINGWSFDV